MKQSALLFFAMIALFSVSVFSQAPAAKVFTGWNYSVTGGRGDGQRTCLRKFRIDHRDARDHELAPQAAFNLKIGHAKHCVPGRFRTASGCGRNCHKR